MSVGQDINYLSEEGRRLFSTLPFVEIIELLKKSLNAKYFFTNYANGVRSWNKKLSGKNSNGNPVDFTEDDKKIIEEGFKKLFDDFNKSKK